MRMSVPQTGVLARDRAREQISIDTDHCDGPQPSHRQVAKIGMHRHAAVPLGLMRGTSLPESEDSPQGGIAG